MDSIGFFNNSLINHVSLSNAALDYASARLLMELGDCEEFSKEELTAVMTQCNEVTKFAYCYPGVGLA